MIDADLIVYEIARARIERGDVRSLADAFNAQATPEEHLHAMFGKVMWCVDGYNSDPAELYTIPAVRSFLSEWRRRQPHWLFFGWLGSDNLKVLYLSLLSRATAIGHEPRGLCQVSFNLHELGGLLAADLEVADSICARIGISPARRLERAREVMAYFGFDKRGVR
jgi:hypothetical protein